LAGSWLLVAAFFTAYMFLLIFSLKQGPNDPDKYYKQPGHPLTETADAGGRFKVRTIS
jgi:hypothetical protein